MIPAIMQFRRLICTNFLHLLFKFLPVTMASGTPTSVAAALPQEGGPTSIIKKFTTYANILTETTICKLIFMWHLTLNFSFVIQSLSSCAFLSADENKLKAAQEISENFEVQRLVKIQAAKKV